MKEGRAQDLFEAWVWGVLPVCIKAGGHPLVLLNNGHTVQMINQMAARHDALQELMAEAMGGE